MRKFSKEQQELIVGIVTLVFISLLFVGVHLWRLRCDFLPKEFVLYANFKKSDGLLDNAVVRLAGLPVGKVVSQELTSAYMVRIKMEFDKMPLLSTDTVAVIETDGMMGPKYIELVPGAEEDFLQNGESLSYVQDAILLDDIMAQAVAYMDSKAQERKECEALRKGLNERK